jgi:hypothetical protein
MSYEVLTGPDGEDEERRRLAEMLKKATRKPVTLSDIMAEMSQERQDYINARAAEMVAEMLAHLPPVDDHEGSTPD